ELVAVELADGAVHRGVLAASRRAGHQYDSVGQMNQLPPLLECIVSKAELFEVGGDRAAVHDANDDGLAKSSGHGADAQIDRAALDRGAKAAALRKRLVCADSRNRFHMRDKASRKFAGPGELDGQA